MDQPMDREMDSELGPEMDQVEKKFFPKLVVGLGNPGSRYRQTRHNLGFMVTQVLGAELELTWRPEHKTYLSANLKLATADGESGLQEQVVLMRPQTYMNLSGEAIVAWLELHDLEPDFSRILVICDDLALPLGVLRMRGKGSSGGQNGLESIIDHLDSDQFARLRMGIDGTEGELLPEEWADYVLAEFPEDEAKLAEAMVEKAVESVKCWLKEGPQTAASRHNGLVEI